MVGEPQVKMMNSVTHKRLLLGIILTYLLVISDVSAMTLKSAVHSSKEVSNNEEPRDEDTVPIPEDMYEAFQPLLQYFYKKMRDILVLRKELELQNEQSAQEEQEPQEHPRLLKTNPIINTKKLLPIAGSKVDKNTVEATRMNNKKLLPIAGSNIEKNTIETANVNKKKAVAAPSITNKKLLPIAGSNVEKNAVEAAEMNENKTLEAASSNKNTALEAGNRNYELNTKTKRIDKSLFDAVVRPMQKHFTKKLNEILPLGNKINSAAAISGSKKTGVLRAWISSFSGASLNSRCLSCMAVYGHCSACIIYSSIVCC